MRPESVGESSCETRCLSKSRHWRARVGILSVFLCLPVFCAGLWQRCKAAAAPPGLLRRLRSELQADRTNHSAHARSRTYNLASEPTTSISTENLKAFQCKQTSIIILRKVTFKSPKYPSNTLLATKKNPSKFQVFCKSSDGQKERRNRRRVEARR